MEKPAIFHAMVGEPLQAMETLGADPRLLGAIGSWGDTLDDEAVLALLREWNVKGSITVS